MPITLVSAGPAPRQIAEAEARIRAGIVTDYLAARQAGDRLGMLAAEHLAAQVDASTLDGPRLVDELYGASLGDVA